MLQLSGLQKRVLHFLYAWHRKATSQAAAGTLQKCVRGKTRILEQICGKCSVLEFASAAAQRGVRDPKAEMSKHEPSHRRGEKERIREKKGQFWAVQGVTWRAGVDMYHRAPLPNNGHEVSAQAPFPTALKVHCQISKNSQGGGDHSQAAGPTRASSIEGPFKAGNNFLGPLPPWALLTSSLPHQTPFPPKFEMQ
jgi:hypothetical protein